MATWDTRTKLDAVKKMLSTTTRSIRNVSLACGYPNTPTSRSSSRGGSA